MQGTGDTVMDKSSLVPIVMEFPVRAADGWERKQLIKIISETYEYYTNIMGWQEENNQDGSAVDGLVRRAK